MRDERGAGVLVLVLASRARPYPALVRTAKRTWASAHVDGIETLFYTGGGRVRVRGCDLTLDVPDDLAHVGQKTLACLDHVLPTYGASVFFRTNCSSYVDLPNLRAFVRAGVLSQDFYGGKIGVHEGIRFASGSGYFLGRDLAQLVVDRRDEWDHELPDDVALASLLARHGVEPQEVARQDLTSAADLARLDLSLFHFRCKSYSGVRRDDRMLLLGVHAAFARSRGASLGKRVRIATELASVRAERSIRWRLQRRPAA